MIDVHSHIIYGVDDGPSCIEQSLEMVKEADRIGIRTIVASPHYHESIFNLERAEDNYQELLFAAKDYDVSILLSCEIFADEQNYIRWNNKIKQKANKGGLLLFEFPYNTNPKNLNLRRCIENVHKLRGRNIIPIIAHIERNKYFFRDFTCTVSMIKAGCYIQLDAASIIGVYGKRVRGYSKRLIQMGIADMVASNAHCAEDYSRWYTEAYQIVTRWAGKETAGRLFHHNAKNLLESKGKNLFNVYNDMPV